MERSEQRRILEALVLSSPEPVTASRLAEVVPGSSTHEVRDLIAELNAEYEAQARGFEVVEVAGGYQIRTRPELAEHVRALQPRRAARLSRASLETLAVVAYKQPVTRAEVEHVRGVDAGAVLRTLLERNLIRIAGHREIPGRPMLYATTKRFLEVFGLASLEDLPTLREAEEILPPHDTSDEVGEERTGHESDEGSSETDEDGTVFGSFESVYAEAEDGLDEEIDDEDSEDVDEIEPRGEPH